MGMFCRSKLRIYWKKLLFQRVVGLWIPMADASLKISPCMTSCFAVLLEVISTLWIARKIPKKGFGNFIKVSLLHIKEMSKSICSVSNPKTLYQKHTFIYFSIYILNFSHTKKTNKEQLWSIFLPLLMLMMIKNECICCWVFFILFII